MGGSHCVRTSAFEVEMSNNPDPNAFSSMLAALMRQPAPPQTNITLPNTIPGVPSAESSSINALVRALSGLEKPTIRPPRRGLAATRAVRLQDDLHIEIRKIFRERWTARDGQKVPDPEDLALGNDAVKLDATVLYADMSGSTTLVDNYRPEFAAEIYKAYLASAARIIKNEHGQITAYDGDRIMALFTGGFKNTSAATAALKINWVVYNLINPSLTAQYGNDSYQMRHTIGIDTSEIFAARIGARNDNDIVWVGRAANYAAKLTEINDEFSIYITADVFRKLNECAKIGTNPPNLMWDERSWTDMGGMQIYCSDWTWEL